MNIINNDNTLQWYEDEKGDLIIVIKLECNYVDSYIIIIYKCSFDMMN